MQLLVWALPKQEAASPKSDGGCKLACRAGDSLRGERLSSLVMSDRGCKLACEALSRSIRLHFLAS